MRGLGLRLAVAVAAAVAVVLGVAGCGHPAPALNAPEVHPSWSGCPDTEPLGRQALTFGRTPADFTPVRAEVCAVADRRRSNGQLDRVLVESSTTELGPLLAALDKPDEKLTGSCSAELVGAPWLSLHDASGRWIRPHLPYDACFQPQGQLLDTINQLQLTEKSERVVAVLQSTGATKAGCEQQATDLVWYAAHLEKPVPTAAADLLPSGALRLCRYRVKPDQRGQEKAQGTFLSGGLVAANRRARIVRGLDDSQLSLSTTCAPASRFAVLQPQIAQPTVVYAELDGCRRILWNDEQGYHIAKPSRAWTKLVDG